MYDNLAVFLAGRVAEEIFCDDITTGASNDLERATKMARQMVTRYGMTEALGNQVYGEANHEVFLGRDYSATPDYSEATAQRIDEEVSRIISKAHEVARATLNERKDQMDLMVSILLDRETVDGEALEALLNNTWHDYLEHEDEILAKKAEAEREQEEEDAKRAAEEEQRVLTTTTAVINSQSTPPQPEVSLSDVFSGRASIEDLMGTQQQQQPPMQQPPVQLPPQQQPPVHQPPQQQQPPVQEEQQQVDSDDTKRE